MARSILAGTWAEPGVQVRPTTSADPRSCGMNPYRGNVVKGEHGRVAADDGSCGVCRFRVGYGTHCFLYETCDRCGSEDDPCAVGKALFGRRA
jgi:hypothetical protein